MNDIHNPVVGIFTRIMNPFVYFPLLRYCTVCHRTQSLRVVENCCIINGLALHIYSWKGSHKLYVCSCCSIFSFFREVFCRSLFSFLFFHFWPLYYWSASDRPFNLTNFQIQGLCLKYFVVNCSYSCGPVLYIGYNVKLGGGLMGYGA